MQQWPSRELIMTQLYDMHCHLDFAEDCASIAYDIDDRIIAIDSTVMPSSYVSAKERLKDFPSVHVALGIHPWWIANGRVGEVDVTRFERLLGGERLIGEIGLDFHNKRKESKDHQLEVFDRILNDIEKDGADRLIFLHSVMACEEMFDLLGEHGAFGSNACVMHWFSGTRDDFGRALANGCMFSVNMRMLATKAGREFAKAIPDDRLLLETDSPAHEGMDWSACAWMQEAENTARGIADIREAELDRVLELLESNSKALIDSYCS